MTPGGLQYLSISTALCLAGLCSTGVQAQSYRLTCADGPERAELKLSGSRYGKSDFGFDLGSSPSIHSGACIGEGSFFVSMREPEGNYRVTVVLGGDREAATTVKAEARRLMLEQVRTRPGQRVKRTFVVHVRRPEFDGGDKVLLKPREIGNLDWDEKLTLEFTGREPSIRSIEVEPISVSTVYLAGDSTVVDQDNEPWAAWGQVLPVFFNDKIAIANEAESGETIKSFETERRWAKILSRLRSGDWLLIQFAHNDQKPGRGFVSIADYQELLRKYVGITRDKGAHPVLVTSMHRRIFDASGRIEESLGDYPKAMREVAQELQVPLIDLHAMSRTLFEAMGPEGTLRAFVHYPADTFPHQPEPLKDDTHFNSYGALELAKCVLQGIRNAKLPIAKDIRSGVPPFDPAHPDPPSVWSDPADPFLSIQKPYER